MKKTFEYKIDNEKYNVIIEYKNNKNTYIKVKEDLNIYVTTNILTTKRDIKYLLEKEEDYLRNVIRKLKKHNEKSQEFYYLGEKYDIIKAPFENVEINKNKIYCKDEKSLEKWLKKQMINVFEQRLEYCYNLFEEDILYPKLKIRNMKTRWGVCNRRDDSITLNSKLIRYEIHDIDYVIIHELAHLVHFDHSKAFWQTVEKYMPNYKRAIKNLKE